MNDTPQFGSSIIPQLTEAEIATKQWADQTIRHVICQLEHGETPLPSLWDELPELPLLLRELNRLELRNNILVRKRQIGPQCSYQLVLPTEFRHQVLTSLYDPMGHMRIERTFDLVRARFYWPRMSVVYNKIKTCERCVKRKLLSEKAAPLVNIKTTRPLELVCIDFLSLEPDRSRTKDILVITDHFTKYAVAIPTPNQKAKTVPKCLWDNFLIHYGILEKFYSDQGPDFESRTIKELCEMVENSQNKNNSIPPKEEP